MKSRLWTILVALALVSSLVVLAPPFVNVANAAATIISAGPATGTVGTTVNVTGTITATKTYQVRWDSDTGPIMTNASTGGLAQGVSSDGNVNVNVSIPDAPAGPHLIFLVQATPTPISSDSAPFTLNAALQVLNSSGAAIADGVVGTAVTIKGTGFASVETFTLKFDTSTLTTITLSASNKGSWSRPYTIPQKPGAAYNFTTSGGTTSLTTAFTIDTSLTVTPPNAWVGKTGVSIVGYGFGSLDSIATVTYDGAAIPTLNLPVPTANANGTWSATFTVPPGGANPHPIVATGTSGQTATTNFYTPELVLNPATGAAGTVTNVQGTGFQPNETGIHVTFDGAVMTTIPPTFTADPTGAFSVSFVVPSSAALGAHASPAGVGAYGITTPIATVPKETFTVVAGIAVYPISGPVGTTVTITGSHFAASDGIITVQMDGIADSAHMFTRIATTAVWTKAFTIPPSVGGTHTFDFSTSGGTTLSPGPVNFTVNPAITLSPASGPGGTLVTVNGTGFQAGDTLSIGLTFDGSTVTTYPSPVPVDANGTWTAQFYVPAVITGGAHTVAATGLVTTTPVSATYSGIGLTITPTTGPVGTTVTASGTGFAANETSIVVTWDGAIVASGITAGSDGTWTKAFTVPAAASGAHTVDARGATTLAASVPDQTFTVTPAISLSAASGSPGDVITVTGTGFGASETGAYVSWDGTDTQAVGTVNASGGWSVPLTIPSAAYGAHQVNAHGAATAVGTVTNVAFSVSQKLTLSTTSGGIGTTVIAQGWGFYSYETGIQVLFNGSAVKSGITADVNGYWSTTFSVPAIARGSYSVTASGTSTTSGQVAAQTFTIGGSIALSPASGNVGKTISITGTGFTPSVAVSITYGGTIVTTAPSPLMATSTGAINGSFKVPAKAPGTYTVAANDGLGPLTATFTSATPGLAISPASGYPGKTVTINGSNFAAGAAITVTYAGATVATSPAAITAGDDGAFTATFVVPAGNSGAHTVAASDGTTPGSATATFTVTSSVTPSSTSGAAGGQNTLNGAGFPPGSPVTFTFDNAPLPTTPVTTQADGTFTASVTIPEVPRGTHVISATAGGATLSFNFTVTPKAAPSVNTGGVGDSLALTCKGFGANQMISIVIDGNLKPDTTPASIMAGTNGSFSATIVIPALAGGAHTVTVSDQSMSSQFTFNITPRVTLSVTSPKVGDVVTVTGTGFPAGAAIAVNVNNTVAATNPTPVSANSNGTFRADMTIPPVAGGSGNISFSAGGSNAPALVAVTIAPAFTVSPAGGNVGSQVTVSGTGYPANGVVSITYDGTALQTAPSPLTASAQGTFTATVTIPKSLHGAHELLAGVPGGTPVPATFTMDSTPPPATQGVSPSPTSRVGSFGSQAVTFTWLPVTDPSGVTYDLQVSRDQTFATPVLSRSGLAAATYTTSSKEKLAPGSYYWRVRAVDGASNASAWSQSLTLKVGMFPSWMPLWLFILLIVVVVALIGGVVYLLLFSRGNRVSV